jgi:hypothetical protein
MSNRLNMTVILLAMLVVMFLINWRISVLEDAFVQYQLDHTSTTVELIE